MLTQVIWVQFRSDLHTGSRDRVRVASEFVSRMHFDAHGIESDPCGQKLSLIPKFEYNTHRYISRCLLMLSCNVDPSLVC
jgi:hypothetical protein